MARIAITDWHDARLDPYRRLKDRVFQQRGRFICESRVLVERLFASGLRAESVLVDERRAADLMPHVPDGISVYVVPDAIMEKTTGFHIHTGVLAVGLRPEPVSLEGMMAPLRDPITLMVVPKLKEPQNLGSLIRVAAAFGIHGMILGPQCCDPFHRRCVRVSMGSVFGLPIVQSENIREDLSELSARWGVQRIATVLDEAAEPLRKVNRPVAPAPDRVALMVGHEVDGLSPDDLSNADRRVTIPMCGEVDSLNVAVAAAVCCHHFSASGA